MRSQSFVRPVVRAVLVLSAVLGCTEGVRVLETELGPEAAGGAAGLGAPYQLPAGQGGTVQYGVGGGWTGVFSTCKSALLEGKNGDGCTFADARCQILEGCCTVTARCVAGVLDVVKDCAECSPCSVDTECAFGQAMCSGGRCVPCAETACGAGLAPIGRNGCTWCVPPRSCEDDSSCAPHEICHAGRVCAPGCTSASCCYGNVCAPPECLDYSPLDCAIIGCPEGSSCRAHHLPPVCECRAGTWQCDTPPLNRCVSPG